MRRNEREITDRRVLENILADARVCRLGLSDDGTPYIVPLNFGYRDGRLYFHGAREGRKLDIIARNPRVCFEVDTDYALLQEGNVPCRWSSRYRSVIGWGQASIIEDENEKRAALNIIIGHFGAEPYDFADKELAAVSIIRLDIEEMTGKQAGYP